MDLYCADHDKNGIGYHGSSELLSSDSRHLELKDDVSRSLSAPGTSRVCAAAAAS